MAQQTNVLALVGSFRRGSLNQALLTTAREVAPGGVRVTDFDLRTVPFYDGDLEEAGPPPAVRALKERVHLADALLVITPEYNGGIPAVLKNAIDWSSRRYPDSPIRGKLCAVMGATPGRHGTEAAQAHLRRILERTGAVLVDAPPVAVSRAGELVEKGRFTDPDVRSRVSATLAELVECVTVARSSGSPSAIG